jgi:hypothetical protein
VKYDYSNEITHDKINPGDRIWFVTDTEKFIGNVLELQKHGYIVAYYDKNQWEITEAQYEQIFPRIRDKKEEKVFEIYDKVLVTQKNTKSFGIVIGYEMGLYIVMKYAGVIWRRIVVPGMYLEHHEENYDTVLFQNRKENLDAPWLKWELPNGVG